MNCTLCNECISKENLQIDNYGIIYTGIICIDCKDYLENILDKPLKRDLIPNVVINKTFKDFNI